ncbi:MAG: helix-turn-helix domain-containing protein [Bifidobacteriaceae bacterium]|jgi:transcriptional regulator with XRE-family HTH domain|nr:helix-turn-helix domain-containing protein [Bifidobacteriaceae bacterium]
MVDAAALVSQVRAARQLSMNALADLSGVSVSTISRIEAGKTEPSWAMIDRILGSAGFQLDSKLAEKGSDEPLAEILRRLEAAAPSDREAIVRRFPAAADLAQVARRAGRRRVELSGELREAVGALAAQGQSPIVSSVEAYVGDVSRTRSFTPVVYVDDPAAVTGLKDSAWTSPRIMFLLATTDNVRTVARWEGDMRVVSKEWALLDSLASPGRQPDASAFLLDHLVQDLVP